MFDEIFQALVTDKIDQGFLEILKKALKIQYCDPLFHFSGVLPCEDRHGGLYPNVDLSIWLRSCLEEVVQPKKAWKMTGLIPNWLEVKKIFLKKLGSRIQQLGLYVLCLDSKVTLFEF